MRALSARARGEIAAERLFDDDAPPAAVLFLGEPGLADPLDDRAEQLLGDGEVEQHIAAGLVLGFDLVEQFGQPAIGIGRGKIAGEMGNAGGEEIPGLGVERLAGAARGGVRDKAAHPFGEIVAKSLGRLGRAVDGDRCAKLSDSSWSLARL